MVRFPPVAFSIVIFSIDALLLHSRHALQPLHMLQQLQLVSPCRGMCIGAPSCNLRHFMFSAVFNAAQHILAALACQQHTSTQFFRSGQLQLISSIVAGA